MFYSYNYFRQYNNNEEIKDHKTFYKKFSNEREFGGEFTHLDHLVKTRFANMINPMFNIVLRNHPEKVLDIGCGDGVIFRWPICSRKLNTMDWIMLKRRLK